MLKFLFVTITYIKFGKPSKSDNRQGVHESNTPHTDRETFGCYRNKVYILKFKKCSGSGWETGARAEDGGKDFRDQNVNQRQTL